MNFVDLSARIALRAHKDQTRRDGTTPYIYHVDAVVKRLAGEPDEVRAAGWLHDVLEDTKETPESLLAAGVPASVVNAVIALTKTEGVEYAHYLSGVKANPIALRVKIADMLANLADKPTTSQIEKYVKGITYLFEDSK